MKKTPSSRGYRSRARARDKGVGDLWAGGAILLGAGVGALLGLPRAGAVHEASPAPAAEASLEPARPAATSGRTGAALALEEADGAPGVPFVLSSLSSSFSVRGHYRGDVSWHPEGLLVRIRTGHIEVRPGTIGRDHLDGIRIGLARSSGTSWTTFRTSRLHPLNRPTEEGDSFFVRGFEVLIPGVGEADLEGSWLVLSHVMTSIPEEPRGYAGPSWTYVHGDKGFLLNLFHGC